MSNIKPNTSTVTDNIAKNPITAAPYTSKGVNGSFITYNRGDIVKSQGRLYKCLKSTTQSPLQTKSNWSFTGTTEIYQNSVPPIKPLENQLWLSNTGVLYTWYKGSNGSQWISV